MATMTNSTFQRCNEYLKKTLEKYLLMEFIQRVYWNRLLVLIGTIQGF